jgi:hypothetical protein
MYCCHICAVLLSLNAVLLCYPPPAGGFRPQAQVADEALSVLQQAKALEQAGCFALVLECVPAPIAAAVTAAVKIPTIGIGAGPVTSGQVIMTWLWKETPGSYVTAHTSCSLMPVEPDVLQALCV